MEQHYLMTEPMLHYIVALIFWFSAAIVGILCWDSHWSCSSVFVVSILGVNDLTLFAWRCVHIIIQTMYHEDRTGNVSSLWIHDVCSLMLFFGEISWCKLFQYWWKISLYRYDIIKVLGHKAVKSSTYSTAPRTLLCTYSETSPDGCWHCR